MERKELNISQKKFREISKTIFKDYNVAIIDCNNIFDVKYDTQLRKWMRRRVSRALVTPKFIGYIICNNILVFDAESKRPLLATELLSAQDPMLVPWTLNSFLLRAKSNSKSFIYRLYEKYPEKFVCTNFFQDQPEGFKAELVKPYVSTTQHEWHRLWIEKPDIQSVDNAIYYGYILN